MEMADLVGQFGHGVSGQQQSNSLRRHLKMSNLSANYNGNSVVSYCVIIVIMSLLRVKEYEKKFPVGHHR